LNRDDAEARFPATRAAGGSIVEAFRSS